MNTSFSVPNLFPEEMLRGFLSRIATSAFANNNAYRVSLLGRRAGDAGRAPDWIEPLARWEDGRLAHVGTSHAKFRRGMLVAGLAWEKPGEFLILELPAFASRQELVDFYRQKLAIPMEFANQLSGRIERARGILCVGLHAEPDDEPLVLSVDTTIANGFVDPHHEEFRLRAGATLVHEVNEIRRDMAELLLPA